jgi:asparagine synthetase B (glutamine-hydrolysing)
LSANFYQRFRGPDHTSIKKINKITFLHNLLSITGNFTKQPFYEDGIVCIYNGEIYNYKEIYPEAKSDGECLIKAYKLYGHNFIKKLDGEFSIVLWDLNTNEIIFGLDTFGCKPLFYSFTDGIHFASYKSALDLLGVNDATQVQGNEWFIYKDKKLYKNVVHEFDIENEYKTNFDDWNLAFVNSINKRAISKKPVMMGVSEGYDSGAICSSLVHDNIPFKMYSVNVLDEPSNVLLWRHGIENKKLPEIDGVQIEIPKIKNKKLFNPNILEHLKLIKSIYKKCDSYEYEYYDHNNDKLAHKICKDTYGFLGAGFILKLAREEGYRICLSGLAGDIIGNKEINSMMKKHKNINHVVDFDDNNVYSCEYCCGVHGIEIRYPFLDKNLWQETLWMDKTIYNKWKHPQYQFMLNRKFPFIDLDSNNNPIFEKVGFYKNLPEIFHKMKFSMA